METIHCPNCNVGIIGGAPYCPGCGLKSSGVTFQRLLGLTHTLRQVQGQWHEAFAELRTEQLKEYQSYKLTVDAGLHQDMTNTSSETPEPWTPRSMQNLLLWLGATLVSIAALLFVAYAWSRLGLGGRTAVMAGVTAAFGIAGHTFAKRGLASTAESLTSVALVLTIIDAAAAYSLDLFGLQGLELTTYWAFTCAALAAVAAAYRAVVRIHVVGIFALASAQLPLLLLLLDHAPSLPTVGAVIALQVIGGAAVGKYSKDVIYVGSLANAFATTTWVLAAGVIGLVTLFEAVTQVALIGNVVAMGIIAAAAVAIGQFRKELQQTALTAAFTAAVTSLVAAALFTFDGGASMVALAALATVLLAAMGIFPRHAGRATVAVIPSIIAAVWALPHLISSLFAASTVWSAAWNGSVTAPAREQVAATSTVGELVHTVVVGMFVAAVFWLVERRIDGSESGIASRCGVFITAMSAYVALFAGALPFWLFEAVLTAAALLFVFAARRSAFSTTLFAVGVLLIVESVAWAMLSTPATLLVLGVVVSAAAAYARISRQHTFEALTVAHTAFYIWIFCCTQAAHFGFATSGLVLAGMASMVAVMASRVQGRLGDQALVSAAAAAGVAAAFAATDIDYLSVVLTFASAATAVVSLYPRRRSVSWVSLTLGVTIVWTRLAGAGIGTVEAYTVPLATLVLFAGCRAFRTRAELSSWATLGSGVALALTPSLLQLGADESIVRPALLAWASFAALVAGVGLRLKAPVVLGAGALLLTAAVQVAPYANHLPRWIIVGLIGALLITLGATYEARLRDARRLAVRFGRFR
jgi:hypothetical protein